MEQRLERQQVRDAVTAIVKSNAFLFGLLRSQPDLARVIEALPDIAEVLDESPKGRVILEKLGIYDFFARYRENHK